MSLQLIIKAATEGVTETEAVELAVFYLTTGLVNSAGSIGRFVDDVASTFPVELEAALDAVDGKLVAA